MADSHRFYDLNEGPLDRTARAADADREALVELLQHAHAQGRLDDAELQERLEGALSAKTYAQLDALASDLPGARPQPAQRRLTARRVWLCLPLAVLVAAIVLSGGRALWLVFPAFFLLGRPLLWHRAWRTSPARTSAAGHR